MRIDKRALKPSYLIIVGLAVIILGILIPSFFVNPLSTIGLSIILGSIILLSAYIFIIVRVIRSRNKPAILWTVLSLAILIAIAGSFYIYNRISEYNANKIYTPNEKIAFKDFTLTFSNIKFSEIDLPIDQDFLKIGGIGTQVDCSAYSDAGTWIPLWWLRGNEGLAKTGISDRKVCEQQNSIRNDLTSYLKDNKKLSITYAIKANETVHPGELKIETTVDSGRDLKSNKNLSTKDRLTYKAVDEAYGGITHTTYDDWYIMPVYHSYESSNLGGDIDKGLSRVGTINTDIRNNENDIDIKVTYQNQTRLMRISR